MSTAFFRIAQRAGAHVWMCGTGLAEKVEHQKIFAGAAAAQNDPGMILLKMAVPHMGEFERYGP